MGYNAAPLEKLIEEFSKFPGIGRKGATRMAYQVAPLRPMPGNWLNCSMSFSSGAAV